MSPVAPQPSAVPQRNNRSIPSSAAPTPSTNLRCRNGTQSQISAATSDRSLPAKANHSGPNYAAPQQERLLRQRKTSSPHISADAAALAMNQSRRAAALLQAPNLRHPRSMTSQISATSAAQGTKPKQTAPSNTATKGQLGCDTTMPLKSKGNSKRPRSPTKIAGKTFVLGPAVG